MKRSCIWNFIPVKKNILPKSWEDFCEDYPILPWESYIDGNSFVHIFHDQITRSPVSDKNIFSDKATAEAALALSQLIQLRNAFNGDWVPDWSTNDYKFMIEFINGDIIREESRHIAASPLYFKAMELRDEFLRYFRPLIEKLKPLYGIKEGGVE